MVSTHTHHPLLSFCLGPTSVFTFAAELFSGLIKQSSRQYMGTGLVSSAQLHLICTGRGIPPCIICASSPVLSIQTLLCIPTWLGAPLPFAWAVFASGKVLYASAELWSKDSVQKPLSPELVLKVCVLMESLHGKCVIATQGNFLLLLITNAS